MGSAAALDVLVVDDQRDVRELIKAMIEDLPEPSLAVDTAADGEEALRKLKTRAFDLVFLDYRLPPTDGLDVLDKIRQFHPKTAVVFMTASGSEQVAVAAMKKGAMDYLTHHELIRTDLGRLLRRVDEIRRLVNQNMELRQVSQMKDEFIANVSHELRTPLSIVLGYSQTLREGSLGPINDGQRKALSAVIERAEGLLSTLNNILRIREEHEGRTPALLKPVDLRVLAAAAVERAGKDVARKRLALSAALGEGAAWVLGEEETLATVLDNLLSNAVKFSPAGGPLRVELSLAEGRARLAVADRGPGVAPEILPHVFERFFAANQGPRRDYPGLGLGLPLSKEIVDRHGGRLWLESQGAGAGTTARLELPLCAHDAPPFVVEAAERVRGKRVLIVEDNPDFVDVLRLFLSGISRNLVIETADSGFEALDRIKDGAPSLVILDLMLPGMDGYEVLSRLNRLPDAQRAPVLVLTGYADASLRARAAGARDVLLKPFARDVFVQKVLGLLQDAPTQHFL
ncbi:MAG: response regulator [Elusimicrobia bacterium]|nr:response regulator [Elusimicrobiota bacterium]